MGYSTQFKGRIEIEPPLNGTEIDYLKKFAETRRMNRRKGPYYVEASGFYGQEHEEDVLDYNTPPVGQPGLWCQWVPTPDGTALVWDQGEKFYCADEWMAYLIDHFLKPNAVVKETGLFDFFQDHILSGVVLAQGEEVDDRWTLTVVNNEMAVD